MGCECQRSQALGCQRHRGVYLFWCFISSVWEAEALLPSVPGNAGGQDGTLPDPSSTLPAPGADLQPGT